MFRRKRDYYYSRERSRREINSRSTPRRKRRRGVMRLLGEFLSWFSFLLLITGVVAGGAMYLLHTRFDDAMRRHVEAKFRAAYPQHQVTLNAARRVAGQGIELKGLRIAEPGPDETAIPIVQVEELLLKCDAGMDDLVSGKFGAEEIVLSRVQLHAAQNSEGRWNLSSLVPLPRFSSQQLPITIENSTVQVDLPDAKQPIVLAVQQLKLVPKFESESSAGQATSWEIQALLAGPQLNEISASGTYDVASQIWQATGRFEGLKLGQDLARCLPPAFEDYASMIQAMQVTAQADFQATNKNAHGKWCNFVINGKAEGAIKDERLPVAITDLAAQFTSDGQSLRISNLTGRAGQARLSAECDIGGFTEDAPCSLTLTAERLQVKRQFVATLPNEWREIWSKVDPEGDIDARINLQFDGHTTALSADVDCHNVDFAYYKFPYRLSNGQGRVEWRDGVLRFRDFTAYAHGRKVSISGEVTDPGPQYKGFVEVHVDNPVPIDEKLIAALPESAQRIAHQLDPSGHLTLWARFERQDTSPAVSKKQLRIGLSQCTTRYALFPYPLSDIHGIVTMEDDHWSLKDLEGVNDSARVLCNGGWGRDEKGVMRLSLQFSGTDVPLEDELRNALPTDAQQVWKCLYPRGTVDNLDALVSFDGASRKTKVEVSATKRTDLENIPGRTITIKPTWLPYQLDEVEGTIHYRDGVTQLTNVRGRHDATIMSLQGEVRCSTDGKWQVKFDPLNIDRMEVKHELTTALPRRLGEAISRLHIAGPVSVAGSMLIQGTKGDSSPTSTQWDLNFDMENGGIHCGVQLDHIHGGMKLAGSVDQKGLTSQGSLDIDSLVYQGIQFTRVQGPISVDDQRLALGEWINLEGPPTGTSVVARVFGGTLSMNGEVSLSGDFPFRLESRLSDGDLATISREATSRRHELSGRTFAALQLGGTSKGAHTLRGSGTVELRDADVYELPVMVRLLKLLRVKPPDGTAFTSSELAYHIEGDRIYFDKIHFDGDAVSLDGSGDMTLSRDINLTCFTSLGSDNVSDKLFRPLFKEAGRQLMEIRVTGTLDDPRIDREPLNYIRENIQSILPIPGVAPQSRPAMSRLPTTGDAADRLSPPR